MELYLFSDLNSDHLKSLERMLNKTYWGKDITYSELYTTVSQSTLIFAYKTREDRLIAFCRVLTDLVAKAFVLDFVVDEEFQAMGIGTRLLKELTQSPELKKVSHIELYCKEDVIPFYAQFGFKKVDKMLKLLVRDHAVHIHQKPVQEV